MIILSSNIKDLCSKISPALDVSSYSVLTEVLQFELKDKKLTISVTNKEYFVKVTYPVDSDENMFATVKADTFIKLISYITTDCIEFLIENNNLIIKGNGTYKLPIIYDGDKILSLPEIDINNVTNEFVISSDVLKSINTYNSKELLKGTIFKPVQNLYYVDEKGAITFTNGACVNSFTLEKPLSMLLNGKLVKLFNLFDSNSSVNFVYGKDAVSNNIIQTKVKFSTDKLVITAILTSDESYLTAVPVTAIRDRATKTYPYSVTFDKTLLLQAINRLSVFIASNTASPYLVMTVKEDVVVLSDVNRENVEPVYFSNETSGVDEEYVIIVDLEDFKLTLNNYVGQDVVLYFGDNQAILVYNGNVKIIIPEIVE